MEGLQRHESDQLTAVVEKVTELERLRAEAAEKTAVWEQLKQAVLAFNTQFGEFES